MEATGSEAFGVYCVLVRSGRYWAFVTPVTVSLAVYRTVSILYFTVYAYDGSSQSVLIEHHQVLSGAKAHLFIVPSPIYTAAPGQHG